MSFGISLKGEVLKEFDETVLRGEVEIDGYKESFFAPVGYWSKDDYLRSWKQSLAEGLQNGRHSALLTSMRDPGVSNFLFYWVVFIEGEDAYIQNSVLFLDELSVPFVPDNVNIYIPERAEINEDGMIISQWKVGVSSIVDFYHTL
ncbi:hypothetical protein [Achromobacter denitrificans]|uniref:hypothetical protein n=1 Tax=Achromobacter denitrificans TaxID=32002 RepID=UPI001124EC05|nr:hypothetical protein [Achromobacter denitrificans]